MVVYSSQGLKPKKLKSKHYYYYEPFRRAPERLDVTARRRPTYSVKLRLWKISTFYFKIVAIPTPLTITITPLSAH